MAKSIGIAKEIDEGAIVFNTGNLSFINFTNFSFTDDIVDSLFGFFDHLFIGVINGDFTRIFNINLYLSARGDDIVNHLSACSDNITDLIWINMEGNHLRGIFADFFTWFRDAFFHHFTNFSTGFVSLGKGFRKNISCNAMDLNIHLKSGNAFHGTSTFEVHITEVIFHALDIGKDGVMIALFIWCTAWIIGD